MHDHKREPRNNGYYMRREYNIDLLNEIFLLVNVTLFTGFLRSLPCCWTLIQKPFLLLWQQLKWQRLSICICEKILLFANVKKFCYLQMWKFVAIWGRKFNQNQFTDFKLTGRPVHKLQICKAVLIEFPNQMIKQNYICKLCKHEVDFCRTQSQS